MYLFGRQHPTVPPAPPRGRGRRRPAAPLDAVRQHDRVLPRPARLHLDPGRGQRCQAGRHTIDVAAGTYHENVLIEKTLTLLGAQAGVNPITGLRTNPANESTVDGSIAVQSTSNVRIDGFSLNDPGGIPLVDFASQHDTLTNNIVLPGTKEGVELLEDKLTTVSNNEIESAVLDGINVSGSKSAPLNDTVQGNEVLNTSLDGINLFDANGVVVKGNLVQGSRSVGLTVSQSTDVNAANNLLVANSGGAIFSQSAFDLLQGNTVEFNKIDGIDVEGDQGDVILANSVQSNATSGLGNAIFLSNVSGREAVENNSVLQNHSNGIEVFSTSAKGVKVTGNTVENNGGDGVGLDGTSNIIVAANVLNNNAVGIHLSLSSTRYQRAHNILGILLVSSSSNQMIGNVADNNKAVGILLDAKSTGNTVTENTALGNGVFDAEDLSTGTGTAGTANIWTRNTEKKDNHGGGLGH